MTKELFLKNRWCPLLYVDRHQGFTPRVPGIYAFISCNYFTKEKKVVYIGKLIDLSVRLKLSHKVEQIGAGEDSFFMVKIMITDDYNEKEIEYIKRFKPLYNVQHNPNITRKIVYENGQTLY
jgi:excinuclease UvrABC nuclease subunit